MRTIATFAALFFLAACDGSSEDDSHNQNTDSTVPSVLIPLDTATQNMPVSPMDTSKSDMPIVNPDTAQVKPL